MKKIGQDDSIVITDRGSRRQFFRTGGAMLLAGVSAKVSANTLIADCDRNPGSEEEKNPNQPGTDSDTGASADATGCGRKRQNPITAVPPTNNLKAHASIQVVKIKA